METNQRFRAMTLKPISQKEYFSSVGLVLLSTLCLSTAAAFWKYFTTMSSVAVITFLRFFSPFFVLTLLVLIQRKKVRLTSLRPHFFRALFITISQFCFLFVLSKTNLLLATLLYSTHGLFAPLLMRIFQKVRASNRALISIVISFIGVVVALGTGHEIFSTISLFGLLSGLLTAAGQLIQHKVSKSHDIIVMSFIFFGLCALLSIPLFLLLPSPHSFPPLNLSIAGIVLLFGLITVANQTLKTAAYKKVNKATTLSPYLYATIVFSGFIDWIWYGIVPQFHTILGTIIILFGATLMSLRKAPKKTH